MTLPELAEILFVTRKWPPAVGGMETWSFKLSEELAKLGPVEVIALPGQANGLPPKVFALLAFPFKVAWRYLRRKRAPEILHIGDMALWPIGLLTRLRKAPARIVISAHGTDVSYPRRGGLRGRLYGYYLRLGSRLLPHAAVIANSRMTAAAADENGWGNAFVVPLATDMRGKPAGGKHNSKLLFAGRLIKLKGCAWFIRNVLPKLPDGTVLQVAGTALDEIERTALAASGVEYLGKLDQTHLAAAYREAMCVVVPNIELPSGEFEGFGLVAPEAAAAGGVVLAAHCGALPEAVVDGKTGFLVAPQNPQAWVAAITRIANWTQAERTAFTGQSMKVASKLYSWQRVAKEVTDIYARVLSQPDT